MPPFPHCCVGGTDEMGLYGLLKGASERRVQGWPWLLRSRVQLKKGVFSEGPELNKAAEFKEWKQSFDPDGS